MRAISLPSFSERQMFRAPSASHASTSIDPNAPGAGQHDAPLKSLSSISNFLDVFTADASMPGYRLGAIQPRKKLYSSLIFSLHLLFDFKQSRNLEYFVNVFN